MKLKSKILLFPALACVIILSSFLIIVSPLGNETIVSLPTPTPFLCPDSEWVDCMPIVDESRKSQCTTEYLNWAKVNCPGFQGAAL